MTKKKKVYAAKFQGTFHFPKLLAEDKEKVHGLLNAKMEFHHAPGKKKLISEVTVKDIEKHAKWVAAIENQSEREKEIKNLVCLFFLMALDAQDVCKFALAASKSLEELPKQLRTLTDAGAQISKIRPVGRDE